MTNDDFKAWRAVMGYSQVEAAKALDISKSTVELYERGSRRDTGEPVTIPLTVSLACAALYHRMKPWGRSDERAGIFG